MKKKSRISTIAIIERFQELFALLKQSNDENVIYDLLIRIDEVINLMIQANLTAHDNKSRKALLKIIAVNLDSLNYKRDRALMETLQSFRKTLS